MITTDLILKILMIFLIIYLIFFRKETFLDISETDLQAINNLASMYEDGELKISKLHVTDDVQFDSKLNVNGDVQLNKNLSLKEDIKFNGGNNWTLHAPNNDESHKLFITPSDEKNSEEWKYENSTIFNSNGDIENENGTATIGNAYIGKFKGTDNNYVQFSHKNFKNDVEGYSILQHNTGTTYLNSKDNMIHLRKNNDDRLGTLKLSILKPANFIPKTKYPSNRNFGHTNNNNESWTEGVHKANRLYLEVKPDLGDIVFSRMEKDENDYHIPAMTGYVVNKDKQVKQFAHLLGSKNSVAVAYHYPTSGDHKRICINTTDATSLNENELGFNEYLRNKDKCSKA